MNNDWKWNLDDILKVEDIKVLTAEIEKEIEKISEWEKKMSPEMTTEEFGRWIVFDDRLGEKLSRLNYLPYLMISVNQKDSRARVEKAKAEDLVLKATEASRKIEHWIKGLVEINGKKLDKGNAKRLFSSVKEVEYNLKYARQAGKYTRNEAEENILVNKDINGLGVLKDLRTLIETEQEYRLRIKGERVKNIKTTAELIKLTHSTKGEEREAAYRALLEKYKDNLDKYFLIYKARVKDWKYETKIRGYSNPIGMRNFANEVEDVIVDKALKTIREKRVIFESYFKIKAKILGVKKLKRFDIYAPIGKIDDTDIGLDEGKKEIIKLFEEMGGEMGEKTRKLFESGHIDFELRPLKRSGAFCATVGPTIVPYILLNFNGKKRDIKTMVHEIGHGIHSLYANKHHYSNQQASLVLAETASTLAEVMMADKILENTKEKEMRTALLAERLEESWATIIRQAYLVLFEKEVFENIESMSMEDMSKSWMKYLKEQFGETVEIDEIFQYEWAYIPHIVQTPFYCYAYSLGELLALGLYGNYKKDRRFLGKIEEVLRGGGSRSPKDILERAGIKMEEKTIWERGFEEIDNWLKEFEKISG